MHWAFPCQEFASSSKTMTVFSHSRVATTVMTRQFQASSDGKYFCSIIRCRLSRNQEEMVQTRVEWRQRETVPRSDLLTRLGRWKGLSVPADALPHYTIGSLNYRTFIPIWSSRQCISHSSKGWIGSFKIAIGKAALRRP